MDSHQEMQEMDQFAARGGGIGGASVHDGDSTSGIRIRDEQGLHSVQGLQSASNVNSSSVDRESPLEIRFNHGQYAQNPSTITLG